MTSRRRERVGAGQTTNAALARARAITPLSTRRSQTSPPGARAQTATSPQSSLPHGARDPRRATTATARGDSARSRGGHGRSSIMIVFLGPGRQAADVHVRVSTREIRAPLERAAGLRGISLAV